MRNFRIVFFLSVFVVFLYSTLNAQIHHGSLITGSNLSISSNFKPIKKLDYQISPDFGVFVSKKIACVGELYIKGSKVENNLYKSFSFGGFYTVRYYFATEKLCPFGFFKVGGFYTRTKENNEDPISYETNLFMPGIGLDYFMTENIAIESNLGYGWGRNNKSNTINKYNNISFNAGLQFFFSLPARN